MGARNRRDSYEYEHINSSVQNPLYGSATYNSYTHLALLKMPFIGRSLLTSYFNDETLGTVPANKSVGVYLFHHPTLYST